MLLQLLCISNDKHTGQTKLNMNKILVLTEPAANK